MTPTAAPDLIRPHEAASMYDRLVDRRVVDPDTGEAFTLKQIDMAIQDALETARATEGWPSVPYSISEYTWDAISVDVAAHLGLDYDEVWEVAP